MINRQDLYSGISSRLWLTHNGKEILIFRLTNNHGAYIELTNYGAALLTVVVPDKDGELGNVVAGYSELKNNLCHNDPIYNYSLQDGIIFFTLFCDNSSSLTQANLQLTISYSWNDQQELQIQYKAIADRQTEVFFQNHTCFNLSGKNEELFNHELTVYSNKIAEGSGDNLKTEAIDPIDKKIDGQVKLHPKQICQKTQQDIYYIFDEERRKTGYMVCRLQHPVSGRNMEIQTSYPLLHLHTKDWTGTFTNSSAPVLSQKGICLKCMDYSNHSVRSNFSSGVVAKDCIYSEFIKYKFGVINGLTISGQ